MKKSILFTLIFLCYAIFCIAQQKPKYEPQLLILAVGNVSVEAGLQKEVDAKNTETKKWVEQALLQAVPTGEPENINLMQRSTKAFLQQVDFSMQIPVFAQNFLIYRFYERFTNCLILLRNEKSNGTIEDLKRVADEQKMPYILNFPKVSFYKQNGEIWCKMSVQLYEQQSSKLLLDKEYSGDWNNHGFEFTCDQGTIGCTINNSLSQALPDVISQIASNNQTLINQRTLAGKRSAYIASTSYPKHFDISLIQQAIVGTNLKIDMSNLYQCFYNEDATKFVGFFIKTINKKDAKPMFSDSEDQNVKVITSKDILDTGYLNQSPRTYAYIVRGIKFNGKWYADKSEVTYFDASSDQAGKIEYLNNLQKWDFFAENSAEPSVQFWEGSLFEKIADKRKDPQWEKYKNMWADEERENRDYIGQYELVASNLKKEKEVADKAFRNHIKTDIMVPFYYACVKSQSNHIIKLED
ncbi:MAG: hypothetical protein ACXVB6_20450, partial [Mucilaginibacter sp.]